MNSTVALQTDYGFVYTNTLLLLGILALVIFIGVFTARLRQKRTKSGVRAVPVQQAEPAQRYDVRKAYLKKLAALEKELSQNKIAPRECYQRLSVLIRNFVQETTGTDVTTKTLLEIRMMRMPGLERLLEEYYEAEFGPDDGSGSMDPKTAVEKTKKVIKSWN